MPAEQRLAHWFRERPAFGRRDRLRIADGVYHLLRHRRLYEALARVRAGQAPGAGSEPAPGLEPGAPRPAPQNGLPGLAYAAALVGASRSVGGGIGDALADVDRHRAADLIAAVETESGPLTPAERFSLPDWFWARLVADYDEVRAASLALALLDQAPTDLRVNTLKARPAAVRLALAEAGIEARPIPDLAAGLRIAGRAALETLALFRDGGFERQDAGSQRIVAFAGARRGQTVVDFCAGAGGKTLALAAAMRNQGRILAFDPSDARLERLKERCRRAGVTNVTTHRITDEGDGGLERYVERADLVIVDAPCSGSGTLRRDPGLKWLLQGGDIADQASQQARILAAAARLVAPGGQLVYATCSLFQAENEAVIGDFDRRGGAGRLQWAPASPSAARQDVSRLAGGRPGSANTGFPPVSRDVKPRSAEGPPQAGVDATPPDGKEPPTIGPTVGRRGDEAKWTPDRDSSDGFYAVRRTSLAPGHYNNG